MKLGDFDLETMHEIWGRDSLIEVGPDRDGLDLIEIRLKEKEGGDFKLITRITLTEEQAQLVSAALTKCMVDRLRDKA